MTGDTTKLEAARARALLARGRLRGTLGELQERVNPVARAEEVWDDVRERGVRLAEDAADFARERPTVTSAAAGIGIALLFHRPLVRAARRLLGRGHETPAADEAFADDDVDHPVAKSSRNGREIAG